MVWTYPRSGCMIVGQTLIVCVGIYFDTVPLFSAFRGQHYSPGTSGETLIAFPFGLRRQLLNRLSIRKLFAGTIRQNVDVTGEDSFPRNQFIIFTTSIETNTDEVIWHALDQVIRFLVF